MNNNILLPVGSIVKIKNMEKEVMITGFYHIQKEDSTKKIYDYMGCIWPEGIIDTDQNLFFNNPDIDRILFEGLKNEEEQAFKEKLQVVYNKITKKETMQ